MQFPESWLRQFCNPPLSTEELADVLTMGGFEVEEVTAAAPSFSDVVVAEIKQIEPHPDADRLRVCEVDAGQDEWLRIVCGAPNARVGIKVPCALVGAQLPGDDPDKPFVIQRTKLRGVASAGMLCSARELGISQEHEGLLELTGDWPVGHDIRLALNLDEKIFTVSLTPNLGHALSVYGIARELSALTDTPLNTPHIKALPPVHGHHHDVLPVRISAPDLCGRFSGRVMRGIDPQAQTPAWMVERLARCGQRSVAPLVDISNYVMFEYGRPTHIFDVSKIQGGLDVRWGRAGEKLELLNGNTIEVDQDVGVIADEAGLQSLAGIMGGEASAVVDETTDIYIEAAFWWPDAVAGRSRRYNFATDAGHRFERGVDPSQTVEHIEYVTRLILDICGTGATVYGPVDDQQVNMPLRQPVDLRVARASKIIGVPISQPQCADVFRRLNFKFSEREGLFEVTPPMYRFDISIEEDLIEELARLVGYQNLPDDPATALIVPSVRSESRRDAFRLRHLMADLGYLETINFSFVPESWEHELAGNAKPIRLLNPIASHMDVMRSSLMGSLLQVAKYNIDRRASRLRIFELGRSFMRDEAVKTSADSIQGIHQPLRLAGLIYGPAHEPFWQGKQQPADFFDIKADVQALLAPRQARFEPCTHPALHPGRAARIMLQGQCIGHVGQLHPRWTQSWDFPADPLLFELQLEAILSHPVPELHPLLRQQLIERDIAVVVNEQVTHDVLIEQIRAADTSGALQHVSLFDIYRPKPGTEAASGLSAGEKSMALHLLLTQSQDDDAQDADAVVTRIVQHLGQTLGARLRH